MNTEVAIVGGGPAGLVLALFLDRFGVKCTLFNTEETSRWHPKGNGNNARTMEIYRQLGIADIVRSFGVPSDHPYDQSYFARLNRPELYRVRHPCRNEIIAARKRAPVTDQFPEPTHHGNQMYVERFLLQQAHTRPNIDMRFGWDVKSFTQNAAGVTLHAQKADGSAQADWTAAYAVGCDGGRSLVRKALGIGFEGDVQLQDTFMAGQFYSLYLRIPDLYPRFLHDRRAWMYWALSPNPGLRGQLTTLNGADEFMMLIKPHNPGRVDENEVRNWIVQFIGEEIPVEVISYVPWIAGAALVAERYRDGRVFLAGDAAHLFTPTGGFGCNTGIDDASNLSWKLAAAVKGWGGARLLDSYEIERKPIGHRNTAACRLIAVGMQEVWATDDIVADGPAGDAARQAAINSGYVQNNHFLKPEETDFMGIQIGGRYDDSPVIVSDGALPPPETLDEYIPSGVPGGRAPHLWLDGEHEQGSSLYDRLGFGFTLLRFNDAVDGAPLQRAAADCGVPFAILDVNVPAARGLYGGDLALVRPDRYIAWRGDRLPDDPHALLARVAGMV